MLSTLLGRLAVPGRAASQLLLVVCLLSAANQAAAAEPSSALPMKAFFRNADMQAARLSPSGRWLAVATGAKSARVALIVVDLTQTATPVVVVNFADADVRSFEWVNDDRLVFNVVDLQSGMGEQGFGPGLYSVRRDGSERRRLVHGRGNFVETSSVAGAVPPLAYNHMLLSIPETGGDEVIVGEYRWNGRGDIDRVNPKRLNIVTGRAAPVAFGAPDNVREWVFDPQGEPRALVRSIKGEREVMWRGAGDAAWRVIAKHGANADGIEPVSVDRSGQLFVVAPGAGGHSVLKRYDFAAGRVESDALVSTPGFDFGGDVITDRAEARALGVRVNTDAESTVWFDAGMKKLQALADARFPGRVNRLSCLRCAADSFVLLFSYSDQDPGSYWVYRPGDKEWDAVGRVRGDIEPARMAQLDFHRIKARDGQDLPLWVTRPAGKPATGPLPAVVLVHGGPWLRGGYWRWDGDAQFLASRGYVVIEPEFRGSAGYGFQHFQSGWKKWGTAMQDDVADAMQWAAKSGLIDAKRVCVAGASYGGYATLMSLVRYPDLYKCGVAWVAVSDPRLLMEDVWSSDIPAEARRYRLPELIGDPVADAEMLKAATPVDRAGEIRVPLLMAFGREDRRVPLEHGDRMRTAMRAAGQAPEFVVYDGEGHGWLKMDNRLDFWQRVERFLDKQLR